MATMAACSVRANPASHMRHAAPSCSSRAWLSNGKRIQLERRPYETHSRGELVVGNSVSSGFGAKGFALGLGGSMSLSFFSAVQSQQSGTLNERVGRQRKALSPRASFLGVGAPEALVIGVVALIVFGPKGLAEVAKNLGKTLRSFQPTIKELQQISQDFKSTLEQEIGLDEIRNPPYGTTPSPRSPPPPPPSNPSTTFPETLSTPAPPSSATSIPTPSTSTPSTSSNPPASIASSSNVSNGYTSEEYLRITQEQLKSMVPEDVRKASEIAAWKGVTPSDAAKSNTETPGSPEPQITPSESTPKKASETNVKKDN